MDGLGLIEMEVLWCLGIVGTKGLIILILTKKVHSIEIGIFEL
jgi:hypothetical protein